MFVYDGSNIEELLNGTNGVLGDLPVGRVGMSRWSGNACLECISTKRMGWARSLR